MSTEAVRQSEHADRVPKIKATSLSPVCSWTNKKGEHHMRFWDQKSFARRQLRNFRLRHQINECRAVHKQTQSFQRFEEPKCRQALLVFYQRQPKLGRNRSWFHRVYRKHVCAFLCDKAQPQFRRNRECGSWNLEHGSASVSDNQFPGGIAPEASWFCSSRSFPRGKRNITVANAVWISIFRQIEIFGTLVRLTNTQTYFTPAELIDFSLLEQTTEHLDRKFCGFFFFRTKAV